MYYTFSDSVATLYGSIRVVIYFLPQTRLMSFIVVKVEKEMIEMNVLNIDSLLSFAKSTKEWFALGNS